MKGVCEVIVGMVKEEMRDDGNVEFGKMEEELMGAVGVLKEDYLEGCLGRIG